MNSFPQATHLIIRSLKSDGGAAASGGNVGSGNLSLSHVSSNSLDLLRSRSDIDTSKCVVERPECVLEGYWQGLPEVQ